MSLALINQSGCHFLEANSWTDAVQHIHSLDRASALQQLLSTSDEKSRETIRGDTAAVLARNLHSWKSSENLEFRKAKTLQPAYNSSLYQVGDTVGLYRQNSSFKKNNSNTVPSSIFGRISSTKNRLSANNISTGNNSARKALLEEELQLTHMMLEMEELRERCRMKMNQLSILPENDGNDEDENRCHAGTGTGGTENTKKYDYDYDPPSPSHKPTLEDVFGSSAFSNDARKSGTTKGYSARTATGEEKSNDRNPFNKIRQASSVHRRKAALQACEIDERRNREALNLEYTSTEQMLRTETAQTHVI